MSDRIPTLYEQASMLPGTAGPGWSNLASGGSPLPATNNTGLPTWNTNMSLTSAGSQTGSLMQGLGSAIGDKFSFGGGNKFGSFLDTNVNGMTIDAYSKLPVSQQMGIMNSFNLNQMNQGPGLLDMAGTLMQGINMFKQWGAQNQYLDMMKEQLGMAKEQWSMTKDEVSRIARVRNNLNSGYQSGNYGASPTSKTYA